MERTPAEVARPIITRLLDYLAAQDWNVVAVDDGDDSLIPMHDRTEVMATIFSVDWSQVVFQKAGRRHVVALILSNGEDVISDYSMSSRDDFGSLMDAFIDQLNAAA